MKEKIGEILKTSAIVSLVCAFASSGFFINKDVSLWNVLGIFIALFLVFLIVILAFNILTKL
jgi:hypothetical protein